MRAQINNTEIYFDIDGHGSFLQEGKLHHRLPLFILPGGPGADHMIYKAHSSHLKEVAQLVYFDPRGTGQSQKGDPATYTMENYVEDLEALRKHLGFSQIALLGTSYGGMVAQAYTLKYPHQVAKLILVATVPSYRFLEDARRNVLKWGNQQQIQICEKLWAGSFQNAEELDTYFRLMGPLYSDKAKESATFVPTSKKCVYYSYEALNLGFSTFMRTFDFTPFLSQILCPTLILAGDHDWICDPKHSSLMAELIPQSTLKVFKSSHSVANDAPKEYQEAIFSFLQKE